MADLKISQLSDGGAAQAADEYVVARSGANYRIDGASVAAAATSVGTLSSLTVSGDLTVDTSTLKVDSTNNRTLMGITTARNVGYGDSGRLNIEGTSYSNAAIAVVNNSNNGDAPSLNFGKSRGTTTGSYTAVQSGDGLGIIDFVGANGSAFNIAARIVAAVDGTVSGGGTNDMPGRLEFYTTADGSGSPVERMRIDASGNLGLGVTPSAWSSANKALQFGSIGNIAFNGTAGRIVTNAYFDSANNRFEYVGTGQATAYVQDAGRHIFYNAVSGNADDAISFTQAMTLDASGNLGVGLTPTARLHVLPASNGGAGPVGIIVRSPGSSDAPALMFEDNTGASAAGILFNDGDNTLRIYNNTGSTERARITSGGYFKASNAGTYAGSTAAYHEFISSGDNRVIRIQNTNNSSPFGLLLEYTAASPNGTSNEFMRCTDNAGGGTERASIRSNGGFANYSANDVNLASDERLKKDISPLASTWDRLKAIEVVNYRYKDCNDGDPALYGVIAQQVQPIVPELVVVTREAVEAKDAVLDEDGNEVTPAVEAAPEYYGIREQPMYWLAIKALQEAQARIEALEVEVAALKAGA